MAAESIFTTKAGPRTWLVAILIVTALAYGRSLGNEFVFDDHYWIGNPYLGDWLFLWKSAFNDAWWFLNPFNLPFSSYYRPFMDAWPVLNFHLFGLHPVGWHAGTIALHLLVVWLVFRVAAHLTADRWTGVLAAAMFALMPVHAEAVAYFAALCQPLYAALELGAFECYLRGNGTDGADRANETDEAGERKPWLALSLVLFGGALLTYESAVAFPALIALHTFLYSPLQKGEGLGGRFRGTIAGAWPYALEVAAYLAVRFWVLGFISRPNFLNFPPLTAREVALTLPGAIWNYAVLLVVPWRAAPAHQLAAVRSIAAPEFYLPAAKIAVLCSAGFLLLKRHPHRRLYLFCAAWILIALAPALNLGAFFAEEFIHDRYLYLPSFGFCVMAADLAVTLGRGSERRTAAVWIGSAAVSIAYVALLFRAQGCWHDDAALFLRCVEEAPAAAVWHSQLGTALMSRDELPGARRELEAALKLAPDSGAIRYDLGRVYDRLGDRRAAARAIAEGLKRFKDPRPDAFAYLAMVADAAGEGKESEAALGQAAAMPGGAEIAAVARAQIRFIHGDRKGAEDALREHLRRDPDNLGALTALGTALSAERRYQEALEVDRRAARIAPQEPNLHYQIAALLHRLGREREARDECAAVLAMAPDNRGAQALMAAIEQAGGTR